MSQRGRKLVEELFGCAGVVAELREAKWRGRQKVAGLLTPAAAAYDLVRMQNLTAATARRLWSRPAGGPLWAARGRDDGAEVRSPELSLTRKSEHGVICGSSESSLGDLLKPCGRASDLFR